MKIRPGDADTTFLQSSNIFCEPHLDTWTTVTDVLIHHITEFETRCAYNISMDGNEVIDKNNIAKLLNIFANFHT